MTLEEMLDGSPYQDYAYSYPHKTAYRRLDPPVSLEEAWADEDQSALFLYVHIPFCEMRCGFCNLFTVEKPDDDLRLRYLDALEAQCRKVRAALDDDAAFARLAVGGGTPSQLGASQLERLFDLIEDVMGADTAAIPGSVEVSPETVTADKLAVLTERGVDRISIGVQSFVEEETRAVRRPVAVETTHSALRSMREAGFATLNLDLIYGMPGQTEQTWRRSLDTALEYAPEELYLYPLYVRPLTGLGNSSRTWDDHRLALYRQGRDYLLERDYEQVSMRMFRRRGAPGADGPVYCCQDDGMVGLGAGARSYTRSLHYSTRYAVGRRGRLAIIEDYVSQQASDFSHADYGIHLDEDEQRRRWVILSVLAAEGLDASAYRAQFGRALDADFPQLAELFELGLAVQDGDVLRLSAAGLERSDVIGPWLFSERTRTLSDQYELR